jgi:ketosteroid isomerase-like protein
MYKAAVRKLVRVGIRRLNDGDPAMLLRMASPDIEFSFPGSNSWAAMNRPVEKGRRVHVTHRGRDECRIFADRFVAEGLHLEIEDILVNGPPWHLRVAIRAYAYQLGPDGSDQYNNRAIDFMDMRWGRIVRWELYEDSERSAAWDREYGPQAGVGPALEPSTRSGADARGAQRS